MNREKFSPKLLHSILEAEGIDIDELPENVVEADNSPPVRKMSTAERKKTLKKLAMLINWFRTSPGELMDFPVEDLFDILRLLAELSQEAKQSQKDREEKRRALHVAAAMLRRMLHNPEASHYRVLGLEAGADAEQIEEHYHLLHELFWFDEGIDPQRKSRLRISEAYSVLKDPESRARYDEDLMRLEQQMLRSIGGSGRGRKVWWGVVSLALLFLGVALFLYLRAPGDGREPLQPIASVPPSSMADGESGEEEASSGSDFAEQYAAADRTTLQNEQGSEEELAADEWNTPHIAEDDNAPENSETAEHDASSIDEKPPALAHYQEPAVHDAVRSPGEAEADVKPSQGNGIDEAMPEMNSSQPGVGQESGVVQPAIAAIEQSDTEANERTVQDPGERVNEASNGDFDGRLPFLEDVPAPPEVGISVGNLDLPPMVVRPDGGMSEVSPPASTLSAVSESEGAVAEPRAKAWQGMVVIASPKLGIERLTRDQVRSILLQGEPRLPSGKRIMILAPQQSSAAKTRFLSEITGKTPRQLRIHWAKIRFQGKPLPLEEYGDEEAIKLKVARSDELIGLIPGNAVDESVKVLFSLNDG